VSEGRREIEREEVVEYERFGKKKMEKGERTDEEYKDRPPSSVTRGWRTSISRSLKRLLTK
jgi:hypothetical protein